MDFESFTCEICFEKYNESNKPEICCKNGHTICQTCISKIKICPMCRSPKLEVGIINLMLYKAIEEMENKLNEVDEIPLSQLILDPEPFDSGAYGDVFKGKWMNFPIVVKKIREKLEDKKEREEIKRKVNIIIPISHPNIARYYGITTFPDGRLGIVIEYCDGKNLHSIIKEGSLSFKEKIQISLGLVSGLKKLHSKRIAHRDFKPANVVVTKGNIPKILDFGVAKLIQTLSRSSQSIVGTVQYTAPEILKQAINYGTGVDIYSLSISLYELFSDTLVFEKENIMQLMFQISMNNKRPIIPENMNKDIATIIQRGWDGEPSKRPDLSGFQKFFSNLNQENKIKPNQNQRIEEEEEEEEISISNSRVKNKEPPIPTINLWNMDFETQESKSLRKKMVLELREKSNFKNIINEQVFKCMDKVPRHLFLSEEYYPNELEKVRLAYTYNRAAKATGTSTSSSPEIIGCLISLVRMSPSHNVCVVGIKGGYIQSLISDLVGINGKVVVFSSDEKSFSVVKKRVQKFNPLSNLVKWILVKSLDDTDPVKKEGPFDCVLFCGAVKEMEMKYFTDLLDPNGMLIAPIGESNSQKLTIFSKGDDDKFKKRVISDFGVIFGPAI